jgi:opacity protein-like surface antigen
MNRTTRILIAAALPFFATFPAHAAEPGFYFSASVGHAEEDPKSIGANFGIGIGLPPTNIQHIDPSSVDVDDSDVAWGLAVGYRINPHVAAEVEYMDFGTSHITEQYKIPLPGVVLSPATLTRTYSSHVKGPALTMLGSMPLGKSWDVFVRAGVLFADREIDIGPVIGLGKNTFGSTVFLGGAGADWSFSSGWALRAEYQRTGKLDSSFSAGGTELERVSLSVLYKL